jgi:uncharacterized protein (TIGR02145 family)
MNIRKTYATNGNYMITCMLLILVVMSSCKKKPLPEPEQETGTVTDVQGNVYKTIKIGDQWWMAENLRVTAYCDGSLLFKAEGGGDSLKWRNDSMGMYCPNLIANYLDYTRLLYNGYAILNAKKLAPEGWRIPSDQDWKLLEQNLGMSAEEANKTSWRGTHEGEKLKIKQDLSPTNWAQYGEVWGTNESGFTAVPGTFRFFDGTYGDSKGTGRNAAFFWSSTLQDGEPWYRYLDYKNANIFRYYGPKKYGFSVRCIKN